MKNKVAICIAGEMRYWEITKNIFNSFDADIFISTWDTNDRQDNYPYKFHGNKNMNMDIINSLDNLKEAEFLPKEVEDKFTFNILLLLYSLILLTIPFLLRARDIVLWPLVKLEIVIDVPSELRTKVSDDKLEISKLPVDKATEYFSTSKDSKVKLDKSESSESPVVISIELVVTFLSIFSTILNSEFVKSMEDIFLLARGTNNCPEPLTMGAPANIDTTISAPGTLPS